MIVVAVVLWLALGNTRAALVTAVNIPLALLAAFVGMVATGTPANLISLGAVDFGIIVDSTVIVVENIFRHLGRGGKGTVPERILEAASEIGSPMAFSTLIIVVAFIPLFTMTGVAGVIFSPLAHPYAFAIGGAILLAITLTPVIASRFLEAEPPRPVPQPEGGGVQDAGGGEPAHDEPHDNFVMRAMRKVYDPIFDLAARRPWRAIFIALAPLAIALLCIPLLGGEFMPKLEEGNFWIRATLPMSISLQQSATYVGRMRSILLGCPEEGPCSAQNRKHPEIVTVVSQLGRPDDGTDPSGFYNVEFFAPLRPHGEWRRGISKEKMTEQLSQELRGAFPGVIFNFSQYISDNVEEAMSGVKGENTVKVVGPDLRINEEKAKLIRDVLAHVRGIEDLGLFQSLGQPDVRIVPDRFRCARYGLNVGDVEAVVQAAIGGPAVTQVYQGGKHFGLVVRRAEPYRKTLRATRPILVSTPDGASLPLAQVADI